MVKVGFQTPFAYLPLIGGGSEIGGLKRVPPCQISDFPPSSTFHHVSSTQCHPSPSLSPFLSPTCHLLPRVPPHIFSSVATSPMSYSSSLLSLLSSICMVIPKAPPPYLSHPLVPRAPCHFHLCSIHTLWHFSSSVTAPPHPPREGLVHVCLLGLLVAV